jgi:hypothetical protein
VNIEVAFPAAPGSLSMFSTHPIATSMHADPVSRGTKRPVGSVRCVPDWRLHYVGL